MSSEFAGNHLKPFERAMEYVLKRLPQVETQQGHKLPTTRELSSRINVSPATVRNVYKSLADQGILSMEVGSGTYWLKSPETMKREFVIGIDLEKFPAGQPSKSWGYRIYGGMMRAIFEHQASMRLQLANVMKSDRSIESEDVLNRSLDGIDGFILMPSPDSARLERCLEERNIPHVSINPPRMMATRNFVSPDYYEGSYQLGRAFARAGRKRVLALFSPGDDASVSVQLRMAGFAAGLHSTANAPELRKIIIADGNKESGAKAFRQLLSKHRWCPDAVYAAGDASATGVWEEALRAGLSVPNDLSVVGGSGVQANWPGERPLTAMLQPLEQMGEELIGVLERWLLKKAGAQPGIYLPMHFSCGTSTTDAENETLRPLPEDPPRRADRGS